MNNENFLSADLFQQLNYKRIKKENPKYLIVESTNNEYFVWKNQIILHNEDEKIMYLGKDTQVQKTPILTLKGFLLSESFKTYRILINETMIFPFGKFLETNDYASIEFNGYEATIRISQYWYSKAKNWVGLLDDVCQLTNYSYYIVVKQSLENHLKRRIQSLRRVISDIKNKDKYNIDDLLNAFGFGNVTDTDRCCFCLEPIPKDVVCNSCIGKLSDLKQDLKDNKKATAYLNKHCKMFSITDPYEIFYVGVNQFSYTFKKTRIIKRVKGKNTRHWRYYN